MKRMLVALLAAAMLIAIPTGCTKKDPPPAPPSDDAQEREIKDTINIALAYDITSIDPHVGKEMRACIISQQIFDTLVEWDPQGGIGSTILPCLATEWEYLSDTSVQFKLRQGVLFQDGNEMTAEDVKYSMERCMASPQVGYNATWMESVDIVDEYTVVINTHEPYAPMLPALTITPFSIVSKAAASADEKNFGSNPIGTGRYKLVKYTSGEGAQLEAFEDCWRGAPKTKNLDMMIVTENAQRTILLETGEVDIAYEILPNDVAKVEANDALKMATTPGTKCYLANYNTLSKGPIGNKLVRQAIEACIDKQLLVDNVLYGYGTAAYNIVSPANVGYQAVEERPQDLEKARALLTEAGYPGGGFSINLWLDTSNVWMQYAQIIQADLDKVGITLNIEAMESSALQSREANDKDNFDMSVRFMNSLTGDARFTLYNLLYSTSASNKSYWNHPRADELMMQGRAIVDVQASHDLYTELYGIIRDEMPSLPLYFDEILVGLSANVEGFIPRGDGIHVFGSDVVCYK
ncbi:MAG: ABC transporter substrate-binding protein [Clostridiales bacterium]|nr:ABC transporter substrate-binding protein [Clostridiales bacterium]